MLKYISQFIDSENEHLLLTCSSRELGSYLDWIKLYEMKRNWQCFKQFGGFVFCYFLKPPLVGDLKAVQI